MPIKDRRTKLLLLFFLNGTGGSKEQSEMSTPVAISSQLQSIFDISMNQKTKGTLSAMIKDGALEKVEENSDEDKASESDETPTELQERLAKASEVSKEAETKPQQSSRSDLPQYRITGKGLEELSLQFPFIRFLRGEWDGLWRIISYEIPETKRHIRDRFRREMRGWGLGPWHRSFWITPHPIISNLRDLVYGREEAKYVQAFESTHVFGDMDVLVEKVWGKQALEKAYRELFKSWHGILSEDIDKTAKMSKVVYSYVQHLRDDPGLPKSLVGDEWIGFEALSIFVEMRGILLG